MHADNVVVIAPYTRGMGEIKAMELKWFRVQVEGQEVLKQSPPLI